MLQKAAGTPHISTGSACLLHTPPPWVDVVVLVEVMVLVEVEVEVVDELVRVVTTTVASTGSGSGSACRHVPHSPKQVRRMVPPKSGF